MTTRKDRPSKGAPPLDLADDVARLLQRAAPDLAKDEEPGDAAWDYAEAARQSAVAQQKLSRHKRRLAQGFGVIALAASLGLAVLGGLNYLQPPEEPLIHARTAGLVLNATDGFQITTVADGRRTLDAQSTVEERTIEEGALLVAGEDSFLWLELANTALIHVQPGSELTIQPDAEIWLHSGRIYVNATGDDAVVTTLTRNSRIADIGTEYEVAVVGASTEVRTREGAVNITTSALEFRSEATAAEAERVLVDPAGAVVEVTRLSVDDQSWSWRHNAVPPFAIEGKTVAQLADWISRVEGRGLDFATDGTEFSSRNEYLRGGELAAEVAGTDGVELLNAISGFDLEKSDGRYLLRRKRFN